MDKVLYWTAGFLAALALILSLTDMAMIKGNQKIQGEVNQRQNIITSASRSMTLNQQLSQALFDTAVKEKNENLKETLVSLGYILPTQEKTQAKTSSK